MGVISRPFSALGRVFSKILDGEDLRLIAQGLTLLSMAAIVSISLAAILGAAVKTLR